MTRWGKVVVIALWAVVLAEAVAIGAWYGVIPGFEKRLTTASMDATGVVLLIGAVSVGIERAIEYLWTAAGMAVGSFWPVSAAGTFLADLTAEVDRTVAPHVEQAQAILKGLKDAQAIGDSVVTDVTTRLTAATAQLEQLKASVRHSQGAVTYVSAAADVANNVSVELQALVDAAHSAAGTPEARLALASSIVKAQAGLEALRANPNGLEGDRLDTFVAARASAALVAWLAALPEDAGNKDRAVREYLHKDPFTRFGDASAALSTSITGVTDFLASFKDNPGRRILSLELGIIGGLAVALFTGVDVFAGVANEGEPAANLVAASIGGILFTGVLMGLGSSPTHEVIRVLQESKTARKAATSPEVEQEAGGTSGAAAGGPVAAPSEGIAIAGAAPGGGGAAVLPRVAAMVRAAAVAGAADPPAATDPNAPLSPRSRPRLIRVR